MLRRSALALLAATLCTAAGAWPGDPPDDLADLRPGPVYGSARLAGASKYDQDLDDAPSTVYVRTGGEIRAQGYRTLAEVLESLPGVHLRDDRSYTYTGVRGISRAGDYSSRLLLLIDGIRVNDPIYDSATAGSEFPLDVALIDRVEFVPGPGSALYGPNAELGVVNVVTRSPSQLPGWRATAELADAGDRRVGLSYGGDWGPARVLLALSARRRAGRDLYFPEFDTALDHHGVAVGLDGERNHKLFARATWRDLSFTAAASERLKDEPTGSYGAFFNQPGDLLDRYAFADLAFSRALDADRKVYARLGLTAYDYAGTGTYGTRELPVPSRSSSEARSVGGEVRHVWTGWAGHQLLVGAEFQRHLKQHLRREDLAPAAQVLSDVERDASRYALFVNDEWQAGPTLRLNLGARLDRRLDGQVQATPRLAARWAPDPRWVLRAQAGSAFREPNPSEAADAVPGPTGPDALRVEALRSRELSMAWRPHEQVELSATFYSMRIRDMIELVTQSDGSEHYANRGRLRTRGAEFEGAWSAPGGWQLRGSWSLQHARDPDADTTLTDAPRTLGKLMAQAPMPWPGARLGSTLVRIGSRRTLAGQTLPPATRVNLQFSLAPPDGPGTFAFGVTNLFDRRIAVPGGPEHVQDTIPQDGRGWRLQFGWAF